MGLCALLMDWDFFPERRAGRKRVTQFLASYINLFETNSHVRVNVLIRDRCLRTFINEHTESSDFASA